MKKYIVGLAFMVLSVAHTWAGGNNHQYYRTFWHPVLKDVRLAWCLDGGKECGTSTANRYCKLMGYDKSVSSVIANDIGQTHYLATGKYCKGWQCDGFTKIKCKDTKSHVPADSFYYRKKVFNYPRFDNQRLAWCYDSTKGCGRTVAQSFCKRMGYMRTTDFSKQDSAYATEQLGSKELCYGEKCPGFRNITCFR